MKTIAEGGQTTVQDNILIITGGDAVTLLIPAATSFVNYKVKLFFTRSQSGFEVVTDANGKCVASWIRGGRWNVYFEKAGYMPKKISIQVK